MIRLKADTFLVVPLVFVLETFFIAGFGLNGLDESFETKVCLHQNTVFIS